MVDIGIECSECGTLYQKNTSSSECPLCQPKVKLDVNHTFRGGNDTTSAVLGLIAMVVAFVIYMALTQIEFFANFKYVLASVLILLTLGFCIWVIYDHHKNPPEAENIVLDDLGIHEEINGHRIHSLLWEEISRAFFRGGKWRSLGTDHWSVMIVPILVDDDEIVINGPDLHNSQGGLQLILSTLKKKGIPQHRANDQSKMEFGKWIPALEEENYRVAIEILDQVIRDEPLNPRPLGHRGHSRFFSGNIDGAISDYSKAIELCPRLASAYESRGYLHGKKGDNRSAINDFTTAIRIKPGYAPFHEQRSSRHYEMGNYEAAIEDCNAMITIYGPEISVSPYFQRGFNKYFMNDLEGALSDTIAAYENNKDDPFAIAPMAFMLAESGRFDEALAHADKSLATAESTPPLAVLARGRVFSHRGDREKALAEYEKFEAEELPGSPLLAKVAEWKRELKK